MSAWHNAVRWFTPAGEMVREVRYAGPNDNWHVNCITRRDGDWYATMFGPVGPLGRSSAARNGAGRLVRLTTGDEIVGGLTAPHTPRWLDGLWLVCNSGRGELLAVDEAGGRVVRRADCGHWTRGLAWDDAFVYVGTSRRRTAHDPFARAEVVVLDRDSWAIVERIAVPAQELYDLAIVSPQLLDGVRRGFDVNPLRAAEFRQHRLISELGVDEPRTLVAERRPAAVERFSLHDRVHGAAGVRGRHDLGGTAAADEPQRELLHERAAGAGVRVVQMDRSGDRARCSPTRTRTGRRCRARCIRASRSR